MKLDGNCLEPLIPDGASVLLKKSEPVRAGDIVCIWFHPRILRQACRGLGSSGCS